MYISPLYRLIDQFKRNHQVKVPSPWSFFAGIEDRATPAQLSSISSDSEPMALVFLLWTGQVMVNRWKLEVVPSFFFSSGFVGETQAIKLKHVKARHDPNLKQPHSSRMDDTRYTAVLLLSAIGHDYNTAASHRDM